MTAESFYRRAAFFPVALPLLAAGIVAIVRISPLTTPVKVAVVDVAGFVAIAGVVGVLPYALWAVVAMAWTEPRNEEDFRRLSWLAPITIAVPFGILVALLTAGSRGVGAVIGAFGTWAMLALAVGYFYVVVVNIALLVAKRGQWVR